MDGILIQTTSDNTADNIRGCGCSWECLDVLYFVLQNAWWFCIIIDFYVAGIYQCFLYWRVLYFEPFQYTDILFTFLSAVTAANFQVNTNLEIFRKFIQNLYSHYLQIRQAGVIMVATAAPYQISFITESLFIIAVSSSADSSVWLQYWTLNWVGREIIIKQIIFFLF